MANMIPNQISHVTVGALPDPDNTSTAAIADAGSYTGTWSKAPVGALLIVDLKSNVDLNVQIQFSVDGGTTTDSTLTRYYRTAFINAPYDFKIARPWYRVVVTNNSGGATSTLRLNTYVTSGEPILNIPVDSTMAKDYGAISTRPTDFHSEVALGRRQGITTWNKFGYNADIDVSTSPEVIASFGGTFQFLTSGETIDIVSSSAADDSVGTGVQIIIVYGVGENWEDQAVLYTMDGTTTVTSAESWIGINRVAVFLSGSGNTNAGNITVTATTSGYNMAHMPVGEAVTQQMIFYVPVSHQYMAEWLHFEALKLSGGGGNPEIRLQGWVYSAVNQTQQLVYQGKMDIANQNHLAVQPPVPFPIGEKSIIWFEATTDKDNTSLDARMSGELFRDPDA